MSEMTLLNQNVMTKVMKTKSLAKRFLVTRNSLVETSTPMVISPAAKQKRSTRRSLFISASSTIRRQRAVCIRSDSRAVAYPEKRSTLTERPGYHRVLRPASQATIEFPCHVYVAAHIADLFDEPGQVIRQYDAQNPFPDPSKRSSTSTTSPPAVTTTHTFTVPLAPSNKKILLAASLLSLPPAKGTA